MWNRSLLVAATLASSSLAAGNSIQGFNGTTQTVVSSTNLGGGPETPIPVTSTPETPTLETPIPGTSTPETSSSKTPVTPIPETPSFVTILPVTPITPETPSLVTILPVTPITPAPIGVNTSTITPTGFTLSYTVDKSVATGLTELPTLTKSRTTSAERTIQKTGPKSVVNNAETLSGIDSTIVLGPVYADLPSETTAHARLPAGDDDDDESTTGASTAVKTVDETTALPVVTPPSASEDYDPDYLLTWKTVEDATALPVVTPTTAPEEDDPPEVSASRTRESIVRLTLPDSAATESLSASAVKTVEDGTALPVVTPTSAPEEDGPAEISTSPSPTGGNIVVLPNPSATWTAETPVVKSVEDGTTLTPIITVVKSAGGEATLTVPQVPTGEPSITTEFSDGGDADMVDKWVESQTDLGAPSPTNDVSDSSTPNDGAGSEGGRKVASYIVCGMDDSCFQTTNGAAGSQVVVLPAPTQESNTGTGQPSSPNEQNDGSGQRVPANAPTEDFTYTAGAPTVVYNSNTLSVGGAALTISGAQVTLATGGLVVDGNTFTAPVAAPTPTSQDAVMLPAAAAYTYDAAESTFVYGSATVSAGGPAVTVDGHTVSLAPSGGGVVFDASTVAPSGESPLVVLTGDGSSAYAYTPGASTLLYGSTTLSVGGPEVTVAGKPVTLASDGVVVDGSSIAPEPLVTAAALGTFAYTPGASTLVYGSTTLSVGGPEVTIAGKPVTLASDGVVVDGSSIAPEPLATAAALGTFAYKPGASTLVYGSTTLSVGGPAATVAGQSISLASDGVLVDGSTITPQQAVGATPAPVTYDFTPGASTFVYGSTTLSVGGADTTLAGGQVVSLASGGVVLDGSTLAAATRTPSPAAVVTLGDEVRSLTKGATLSLDGSPALTLTPGAVVTSLPGDGESISVGQNAVVVNGTTVSFSSATARNASANTTRSRMTTSRTTSSGASASERTGGAAAASSTAAAARGVELYSAGALVAIFGWLAAVVGI